ncbi:hypothetical protein GCM10009665_56520 [Kitasatospora nipponensis]|uniref:Polyketide cyclase/dehydrase/lipid transport protein n=1 Tax=Kitasatospora nipponensis TaxID=258049 RepID=A0ABP4HDE8_9ACTN
MAGFELSRTARLPADEAWRRLTDWPRHSANVPFTRVGPVAGTAQGLGGVVVARTSLLGLGFDDPMEIVLWQPPGAAAGPGPGGPGPDPDAGSGSGAVGRCRLEKRGTVVRGWAEILVVPQGQGSRVTWREEVFCRGVPRAADPLLAAAGRRMFGRVLDALLAP